MEIQLLTCQYCHISVDSNDFISHTIKHFYFDGESMDLCKLCEKNVSINSVDIIMDHMLIHHLDNNKCPFCLKSCCSTDFLFYHLKANMSTIYHCRSTGCNYLTDNVVEFRIHRSDNNHENDSSLEEYNVNCVFQDKMGSLEEEQEKLFKSKEGVSNNIINNYNVCHIEDHSSRLLNEVYVYKERLRSKNRPNNANNVLKKENNAIYYQKKCYNFCGSLIKNMRKRQKKVLTRRNESEKEYFLEKMPASNVSKVDKNLSIVEIQSDDSLEFQGNIDFSLVKKCMRNRTSCAVVLWERGSNVIGRKGDKKELKDREIEGKGLNVTEEERRPFKIINRGNEKQDSKIIIRKNNTNNGILTDKFYVESEEFNKNENQKKISESIIKNKKRNNERKISLAREIMNKNSIVSEINNHDKRKENVFETKMSIARKEKGSKISKENAVKYCSKLSANAVIKVQRRRKRSDDIQMKGKEIICTNEKRKCCEGILSVENNDVRRIADKEEINEDQIFAEGEDQRQITKNDIWKNERDLRISKESFGFSEKDIIEVKGSGQMEEDCIDFGKMDNDNIRKLEMEKEVFSKVESKRPIITKMGTKNDILRNKKVLKICKKENNKILFDEGEKDISKVNDGRKRYFDGNQMEGDGINFEDILEDEYCEEIVSIGSSDTIGQEDQDKITDLKIETKVFSEIEGKRNRKKKPFFEYDRRSNKYCQVFGGASTSNNRDIINETEEVDVVDKKVIKRHSRAHKIRISPKAVKKTFHIEYSNVVLEKLFGSGDKRYNDNLKRKLESLSSYLIGITEVDGLEFYVCMTCQYASGQSKSDVKKHILRRHCGLSLCHMSILSKITKTDGDLEIMDEIQKKETMKDSVDTTAEIDTQEQENKENEERHDRNSPKKWEAFCNEIILTDCDIIETFKVDYSERILVKYTREWKISDKTELQKKLEKYRMFSVGVAVKEERKYFICMECHHTSAHSHIDIRKHVLSRHCNIHRRSLLESVIQSSKYNITQDYKLVSDRRMILAINRTRMSRNDLNLMSDSEEECQE